MPDLITGGAQFAVLARNLRAAGETGLRRELYKAISAATGPLMTEIRAGLPDHMPKRYAAVLAGDLSLTTAKTARTGIRLRARARVKARKLQRLDAGVLQHPLFGDRERWYTQGTRPGFFSGPAQQSAPQVRRAILGAMNETARQVTSRG